MNWFRASLLAFGCLGFWGWGLQQTAHAAEEARLLRQPTISATQIAFAYGGDLWVVDRGGGAARRLTSTVSVESDPHFSPDGKWLAFTSDRTGSEAVYVVPVEGGTPARLTWYPADARARGWTPDGARVLYASSRETAPVGYNRLWTVAATGGPSQLLPAPFGATGSFSASGRRIVVDPATRWDREWRHYRGGQNRPLQILNLETLEERVLPHSNTVDVEPVWLGEKIYFLSDRDWTVNIWACHPETLQFEQITHFDGADIKALGGCEDRLVFEREGYLHTFNLANGEVQQVHVTIAGDFPWAEPRWEEVSSRIESSSLSPTGKRALFEARGEIFTVPVDKGAVRNLTHSSGAADRAPVWSPQGTEIAYISDTGDGYALYIVAQDGLMPPRKLSLGDAKMVWQPVWSPDGKSIAFVDDQVQIRILDLASGELKTIDKGGTNLERESLGLTWSPDSKWLAYAKTFPNNYRRVVAWSADNGAVRPLTDAMADAFGPAWSRDGKHLYFLASTNLGLGSGWANTSAMGAKPQYQVYAMLLSAETPSPFAPESDEEAKPGASEEKPGDTAASTPPPAEKPATPPAAEATPATPSAPATTDPVTTSATPPQEPTAEKPGAGTEVAAKSEEDKDKKKPVEVRIDWDGIERRVLALPLPAARYRAVWAGPEGSVFIADGENPTLHKFDFKERKADKFLENARNVSFSADGKKLLYQAGSDWKVCGSDAPPGGGKDAGKGTLKVDLQMRLDRQAEWQQMFRESWRYLRDFFYDPQTHGRDWEVVRERYAPLLPHIRHRADLNYVMDQMSGELSVGHSFVFGGDFPKAENNSRVGVLGADLEPHENRWRIARIYTYENWNPNLVAPLDRAGMRIKPGHYLLAVNGNELTAADDPYRLLDGTVDRQTVVQINDKPTLEGAWTEVVEPLGDEGALRQRAWVEDNRRRVDTLSAGKLAYVWVPNTSGQGVVSFDRYYFAQQDKLGAVIDERFNGGGLLDDYMVDLMTRRLRAAVTNEVPGGAAFRLPAGILGPKVLLINELAGSGGDFFPWVFRQQQAGPLIGNRTWGGLVKSSVHYSLVDGGALTAPDNAVFDPLRREWIGENQGIAPDIEVPVDAQAVRAGRDPQLERGVSEALKLLEANPPPIVEQPPYPTPTRKPNQ